jgi:hypothetical protein
MVSCSTKRHTDTIILNPHGREIAMKPIRFDADNDFAPIPFDQAHLRLAYEMKQNGLPWKPHVGCFVWDRQQRIEPDSPFPLKIYFILSLPRFLGIFGSMAAIAEELVWLPTWHQARLVAQTLGVEAQKISKLWVPDAFPTPGDELLELYRLINRRL